MPCTTILVGKNASYDGSTIIARNDDSPSGTYMPKKFVVVHPENQPRRYESVISHVVIDLPDQPLRYTAMPNAVDGEGIWAAAGVNSENVAMSATETITSNPRVLGADPLVEDDSKTKTPGGIGEEDIVVLTLPYIHSAKEGVIRLGKLLETYGTYESNGIAFQDVNEIWWFESIGGHHWMAVRVPDDKYVVMPNQQGIDNFDFEDAYGAQNNYMCSSDLKEFIQDNHLDLSMDGTFNPRTTFGSHDDADHVYNTPRAWWMLRHFNPHDRNWDENGLVESDALPWSMVPENKITVEEVKYVLSGHFQGTPYDPYGAYGDASKRGMYRSIGINRNDFMALIQLRPYVDASHCAIEWIAEGSNVFNTMMPMYANITDTPTYVSNTTGTVDSHNFYWASRLIAALSDASYGKSIMHVERYQEKVQAYAHQWIKKYDAISDGDRITINEQANAEIAQYVEKQTDLLLGKVLVESSNIMKNCYARSDN